MKKLILLASVAMLMGAISCSNGTQNQNNESKNDSTKVEQKCSEETSQCSEQKEESKACEAVDKTKKFICPAGDYSSDEMGTCPKCEMELIENM